MSTYSLAAPYTWDGGASNDRFSDAGNWDPTAPSGGPGSGDTGTVNGSSRVEVGTSGELTTDAEITFNNTSSLERNSSSFANMSGTYNFNNSSTMTFSDLRVTGTLNWGSNGTFSNGALGDSSQPNFLLSSGAVNMSAGLWDLSTSGTGDALRVAGGVFNMTGGVIQTDDRVRFESTFNLGGLSEVYAGDEFMTGSALFNFQGSDSAFFIAGIDENIDARISIGYIAVDGIVQTDATNLLFQNVNVGGTDYTRISAVPAPSVYALFAGFTSLAICVIRRRR